VISYVVHLLRSIKIGPVLVALLLFVCSPVYSQRRDVCPTKVEDRELVEAVFRYQLEQSVKEKKWNVFYLAFGWYASDEDEACVDRWVDAFPDHSPPVKKFAKNQFDDERIREEKGLVLGVAEIKRKTETEAEVEGYIFILPGEAQGYSYSLTRENGKWIVKGRKGTWTA
jgi:hypothetical protein